MRLCHSMASDSPSEQFYIGRMDTIKNRRCEESFLVKFQLHEWGDGTASAEKRLRQKPIACRSLYERRCRISSSYTKRVKVGETEADAEPGGKATGFGSTRKANSGPAGKTAGAERVRRAGEATNAEIELAEGTNAPFGPIYPSRRRNCKRSKSISESSLRPARSGDLGLWPEPRSFFPEA
jgi:hypothetical protein